MVLLDLGLPDVDGADVLSDAAGGERHPGDRGHRPATTSQSMVRLLDLGADDYVIKPFTAAA